MKSDRILHILIIISLLTLLPFLKTINSIPVKSDTNLDIQKVNSSQISEKIHIVNNSGWEEFKDAGKCIGNGTFSSPYIIKDLIINGEGLGNCIWIEDSDVYFIIENCTLFNSGGSYFHQAGIYIENVSNGRLINNDCSFNHQGIFLNFAKNNTISGNIANNNSIHGIILYDQCNDTKILGNSACFNSQYGIIIRAKYTYFNANNNIVINNNASFNADGGLWFTFINNTEIVNNTALNNGVYPTGAYGISVQASQNITVSMNKIQGNNNLGINVYNVQGISIFNNTISSNEHGGIEIEWAKNVKLTKNYLTKNRIGIGLRSSMPSGQFHGVENCNISENIIIDNSEGAIRINKIFNLNVYNNEFINCGILLIGTLEQTTSHSMDTSNLVNQKPLYYYANKTDLVSSNFTNAGQIILANCNYSSISNLVSSSSSIGISLIYSNYNHISRFTSNHNKYGFSLSFSHFNTISESSTKNNMIGIGMSNSVNNIMINNYIENNEFGIIFSYSNYNYFSKNNVNHNTEVGIMLSISDYNTIKANIVNFNEVGISLWGYQELGGSNNNSIIGNTLIGNNQCIYEDENCHGNIFENNNCAEEHLILGYNLISIIFVVFLILSIMIKKLDKNLRLN